MTNLPPIRSFEYKNDYLYIVIRQAPDLGPKSYFYCSGINAARFEPDRWRKSGIGSNPARKGLQLLRANASARALKLGARTKNAEHVSCGAMTPRGDGWHRESTFLVENAAPGTIQALLEYSVAYLVKTVLLVCAPGVKTPSKLPNPPDLQKWFDSLHARNYRTAASSPFAEWRVQNLHRQ